MLNSNNFNIAIFQLLMFSFDMSLWNNQLIFNDFCLIPAYWPLYLKRVWRKCFHFSLKNKQVDFIFINSKCLKKSQNKNFKDKYIKSNKVIGWLLTEFRPWLINACLCVCTISDLIIQINVFTMLLINES